MTNGEKQITKSNKIGRVAPSLTGLSWSLGLEAKPVTGSRGQSSRKLLGLIHIKEQNQHSKSHLFFFWGFFSSILLVFFSAIRNFFLGAVLPRSRGFRSSDCKTGSTTKLPLWKTFLELSQLLIKQIVIWRLSSFSIPKIMVVRHVKQG